MSFADKEVCIGRPQYFGILHSNCQILATYTANATCNFVRPSHTQTRSQVMQFVVVSNNAAAFIDFNEWMLLLKQCG